MVNDLYTDNMFYWHIEAKENEDTAPLVLWTNGGPGCSSSLGLLTENGPWKFDEAKEKLICNTEFSWHNLANLLFTDQPIGTGFSYSSNVHMRTSEK